MKEEKEKKETLKNGWWGADKQRETRTQGEWQEHKVKLEWAGQTIKIGRRMFRLPTMFSPSLACRGSHLFWDEPDWCGFDVWLGFILNSALSTDASAHLCPTLMAISIYFSMPVKSSWQWNELEIFPSLVVIRKSRLLVHWLVTLWGTCARTFVYSFYVVWEGRREPHQNRRVKSTT